MPTPVPSLPCPILPYAGRGDGAGAGPPADAGPVRAHGGFAARSAERPPGRGPFTRLIGNVP